MKNIFVLALVGLLFGACQKVDHGGNARLVVKMIDAPGDFEQVNIYVEDVLINMSGSDNDGWQSLPNVQKGSYDLMKLVNGTEALLVDAEIPTGRIHQMRLILKEGMNTVKIEGTPSLINLETPSAQQSGLKLNIQHDVVGNLLYTIVLDFDVKKSVVHTGSNKYILKPVIRTILNAVGGSIKGAVKPNTFSTWVALMNENNLSDTIANTFTQIDNGGYLFTGLPAGNYKLYFNPGDATYGDSTRTGIPVTVGNVTIVDTMFLKLK